MKGSAADRRKARPGGPARAHRPHRRVCQGKVDTLSSRHVAGARPHQAAIEPPPGVNAEPSDTTTEMTADTSPRRRPPLTPASPGPASAPLAPLLQDAVRRTAGRRHDHAGTGDLENDP